jgi:hypothetical protein
MLTRAKQRHRSLPNVLVILLFLPIIFGPVDIRGK